jgi:hypothetical protein
MTQTTARKITAVKVLTSMLHGCMVTLDDGEVMSLSAHQVIRHAPVVGDYLLGHDNGNFYVSQNQQIP